MPADSSKPAAPAAGQRKSSSPRRALGMALRLIITALLLAIIFTQLELAALGHRFASLHWHWAIAAIGLTLVERFLQTIKWAALLRAKGPAPGTPSLYRIQLIATFFGSFFPSSVGVDTIRTVAVNRRGVDVMPAVAATLVDRASTIFGQLVLGALAALALSASLPASLRWFIWSLAAITFVFVALLSISPLVARLNRVIGRFLGHAVMDKMHRLYHAILSYAKKPQVLVWTAVVTLVVFVVRLLFGQAVVWAMGVELNIIQLALVLPLLWLLAMLPITLGSFGIQEGAYLVLFGVFGVTATAAVSVSLLEHMVVRIAVLPGGLLWIISRRMPRTDTLPSHTEQEQGEPVSP